MTKVYLVKSARIKKSKGILKGDVYTIIENVFTDKKKAKSYIEYMELCRAQGDFRENEKYYHLIRYYIDEFLICKEDFSERKRIRLEELPY